MIDAISKYYKVVKPFTRVYQLDKDGNVDTKQMHTELVYGELILAQSMYKGYIKGSSIYGSEFDTGYVSMSDVIPYSDPVRKNLYKVTSLVTNVYKEPVLKSIPTTVLSYGSLVSLTGKVEKYFSGFYNEENGTSEEWFIPTANLTKENVKTEDYVKLSEMFQGISYVWGGCSSFGLDCSALVQIVLKAWGVLLPRDSKYQESYLRKHYLYYKDIDDYKDLPPLNRGDIIFWKGHVGIMQDSKNFIHANATYMQVSSEVFDEKLFNYIKKATDGGVTSVIRMLESKSAS